MPRSLCKALGWPLTTRSRVAGLATCLPLVATTIAATPAQASPISCQAINATGLLSGPPPSIPSPACTNSVSAGQQFEIDFSDIFTANGGSLPLNKFYSLQIANLNTDTANTLSFSDIEFLVTGTAPGPTPLTDSAITIWRTNEGANTFTPAFPFAQGVSGYTTNATTNTFGGNPVSTKASFSLGGPVTPSVLGTAALINTLAVNLQTAGITSFTGAKIRGTFNGSTNGVTAFSAGLALFDSDPNSGGVSPTTIYGNAFNNPVPGPLPIVGAGAAFGWSRRLRKRVRKASAVASLA